MGHQHLHVAVIVLVVELTSAFPASSSDTPASSAISAAVAPNSVAMVSLSVPSKPSFTTRSAPYILENTLLRDTTLGKHGVVHVLKTVLYHFEGASIVLNPFRMSSIRPFASTVSAPSEGLLSSDALLISFSTAARISFDMLPSHSASAWLTHFDLGIYQRGYGLVRSPFHVRSYKLYPLECVGDCIHNTLVSMGSSSLKHWNRQLHSHTAPRFALM